MPRSGSFPLLGTRESRSGETLCTRKHGLFRGYREARATLATASQKDRLSTWRSCSSTKTMSGCSFLLFWLIGSLWHGVIIVYRSPNRVIHRIVPGTGAWSKETGLLCFGEIMGILRHTMNPVRNSRYGVVGEILFCNNY